jgi:iron complex outermembrane receptor protein
MKKIFLFLYLLSWGFYLSAQEKLDSTIVESLDTLNLIPHELEEVIVIGNPSVNYIKENKALGSLDSYLEQSNSINMIRRGAYAWEPMLNGMATERSIITIDGMRIFHACTDKMDPITSYVENSNLSKAKIEEGQTGSQYGGTIAGSIDLVRKRSGFGPNKKFGGSASTGFESNNKQQIYAVGLNYSSKRYFADIDFTYRHADNYQAGGKSKQNREVEFSQFTKYNISATTGFKINEKQEIEGSIIYDKATDVGYPGLAMDVSLAEAIIASLQYRYRNLSKNIYLWETKIYFNTITHVMDDTKRPIVPIRMDMPGWSKTQGFYSKILGSYKDHSFKATLSGYRNNSLAEMTMYPNDPNEKDMFMLTWPDINTIYSGVNAEDEISFSPHLTLQIQGGLGVNYNKIRSELGLNSLQLFYPDLKATKTRILKNLSSNLSYHHGCFLHQIGIGYGDRAPSVSEAYGFYLLNTNDNYDYVGNPYLKNEKSLNFNISTTYNHKNFTAKARANYFYIMDFIIGKPKLGLPPMNVNANGIKVYQQLNHASVFNASLGMSYNPFVDWTFSADASYRYGQGANNTILPLIQPFSYRFKVKYEKNNYFAEASIEGSTKNRNSIEFGETQKSAFLITNVALSKNFAIKKRNLAVKVGAENLFNKYYSTFDDWFGIPRMGRNIYANLIFRM